MRNKTNFILLLCVAVLIAVCALSVSEPIRFQRETARREAAVKERLVAIRLAEEQYRKDVGAYSGSFDVLISKGYLKQGYQYIPFDGTEKFSLSATTQLSKSGKQMPLMECGAQYQQYLNGMDENSVANLIETANESGRYPGLKIGDLTQPNNNAGNWE